MGAAASTDTTSGDGAAVAAAVRAGRAHEQRHAASVPGSRHAESQPAQQPRDPHRPRQQPPAQDGRDYFERDEEDRRLNPRQEPDLADALAQYSAVMAKQPKAAPSAQRQPDAGNAAKMARKESAARLTQRSASVNNPSEIIEAIVEKEAGGDPLAVGSFSPTKLRNALRAVNVAQAAVSRDMPPAWVPPTPLGAALSEEDLQPERRLHKRGVTVGWLIQFFFFACDHFPDLSFTTRDVAEKLLVPATAPLGCSYDRVPGVAAAAPMAMVSHAWDRPFRELVLAVKSHFREEGQHTGLWLDLFSLPVAGRRDAGSPLELLPRVVDEVESVLLVLDPTGAALRDAGCLLDISLSTSGDRSSDGDSGSGYLCVLTSAVGQANARAVGAALAGLHLPTPAPGEEASSVEGFLRTAAGPSGAKGLADAVATSLLELRQFNRHQVESNQNLEVAAAAMLHGHILRATPSYKAHVLKLFQRALRIREARLGSRHAQVAQSLNSVANLLRAKGDFGVAEPLYMRSYLTAQAVFGRDNPDIFMPLFNWAELLLNQGRYEEAEPLLRQCLDLQRLDENSDNNNLIGALSSLAYILRTAGEYTEAEGLLWRVQGLVKQEHGGKSREAAESLRRLGDLSRIQGQYAPAVKLYNQALDSGGEHISAAFRAAVLGEMAGAQRGLKDWRAAAASLRSAADDLGPIAQGNDAHARYATRLVYGRLADALVAIGDKAGASAARSAMTAFEGDMDDELASLSPQAAAEVEELQVAGNHSEAASALERLHGLAKRTLGVQSLPTARVGFRLAVALTTAERWTEAKQVHRSVLELRERRLGLDHPDTVASLQALAGVLESTGELSLAEPLYQRLLLHSEEEAPQDGTEAGVPPFLANYVSVLKAQGKLDEAHPLCRLMLLKQEATLGPNHPDTIASVDRLAEVVGMQGNIVLAKQLYLQAWQLSESQSSIPWQKALVYKEKLAAVHMAAGEYEEAATLRRDVVTGLRGCLPSAHHKDAAKALRALSAALSAVNKDASEVGQVTFQATGIEDALATAARTASAGFLRAAHDAEARGDHSAAEAAFRRAVKHIEEVLGEEAKEVASPLRGLARAVLARGRAEDAILILNRALHITELAHGSGAHREVAETLRMIAAALQMSGGQRTRGEVVGLIAAADKIDLELGISTASVAGGAGAEAVEEDNEASVLERQAAAQVARGELANAELLYHLALQERKQSGSGKQSSALAVNLGRLAGVQIALKQWGDAERTCREWLEAEQVAHGMIHRRVGEAMSALAGLLARQGDDKAEELATLRTRMARVDVELSARADSAARALLENAARLRSSGHLPGAAALYRQAIDVTREHQVEEHPRLAELMTRLADCLVEGKDNAGEAGGLYRRALHIYSSTPLGAEPYAPQRGELQAKLVALGVANEEELKTEEAAKVSTITTETEGVARNAFASSSASPSTETTGHGGDEVAMGEKIEVVGRTAEHLGQVGQVEAAEALHSQLLSECHAKLGAGHHHSLHLSARLARDMLRQGRASEAAEVCFRAISSVGASSSSSEETFKRVTQLRQVLSEAEAAAAEAPPAPTTTASTTKDAPNQEANGEVVPSEETHKPKESKKKKGKAHGKAPVADEFETSVAQHKHHVPLSTSEQKKEERGKEETEVAEGTTDTKPLETMQHDSQAAKKEMAVMTHQPKSDAEPLQGAAADAGALKGGAIKFIDSSKFGSSKMSKVAPHDQPVVSVASPDGELSNGGAAEQQISTVSAHPASSSNGDDMGVGAEVQRPTMAGSDEASQNGADVGAAPPVARSPTDEKPEGAVASDSESEFEEEDDEYVMMIETAEGGGAETTVAMAVKNQRARVDDGSSSEGRRREGAQFLWDDAFADDNAAEGDAAQSGVDGGVISLPIHVESEADLAPLREQQHFRAATETVVPELYAAAAHDAKTPSQPALPHPAELNPVKRPGTVGKRPQDSELLIPEHANGFKPLPTRASNDGGLGLVDERDSSGSGSISQPAMSAVQRISFDGVGETLPPVRPPSSMDTRRNPNQHQPRPGSRLSRSDDREYLPSAHHGPPLDAPPASSMDDHHHHQHHQQRGDSRQRRGRGKMHAPAPSGEALRRSEGDPMASSQSSGTPAKRERFVRKPSLSESLRASGPPPRPPPGHIGAMTRRASLPENVSTNNRRKADGGKDRKAALPPVSIPANGARRASVTAVNAVTRMQTVVGSSGRVRVNRFPTLAESMGKAAPSRGSAH